MELQLSSWITHLSGLAAASVVTGLWEGLVLAAVVWMCLRLAPRMAATVRFLLWTITFAVLALVPFLHLQSVASGHAAASPLLRLGTGWSVAIAAMWVLASSYRLGNMFLQAYHLRKIWRRAVPLEATPERAGIYAAGSRKVELSASADVERPSVIGFFSPRILMPDWLLEKISDAEVEQIVLHELEHLRRGDDWFNLMQKFGLALFPLNPVLFWIENRLCLEREMACDDGVLERTASPRSYASCLANLAEHGMHRRTASLSLAAMEGRSQLSQRVYRILRRRERMHPRQQTALAGALLLAMLGGATALAHCPQLVSFAGSTAPLSAAAQLPSQAPLMTGTTGHMQLTSGVKATFVKATMPYAAPASVYPAVVRTTPAARPVQKHRRTVNSRQVHSANVPHGNWLVLTSDEVQTYPVRTELVHTDSRAAHEQVVFTVVQYRSISSSYAAVPTPAGWFVFQL